MDEEASKLMRIIFMILFVCYGIKLWFTRGDHIYRGDGYSIEFPVGWTDYEKLNPDRRRKKKKFSVEDRDKPKTVTYVTEEVDQESGAYAASVSVSSLKLETAAWLEDEWGKIVMSVMEQGNRIIDKGQVLIDEEESKWIFYESPPQLNAVTFEFYIITEGNMFYRISFTALRNSFDKYRPEFERAKDTMKIKKGLF